MTHGFLTYEKTCKSKIPFVTCFIFYQGRKNKLNHMLEMCVATANNMHAFIMKILSIFFSESQPISF